jgi:hypothetical protein
MSEYRKDALRSEKMVEYNRDGKSFAPAVTWTRKALGS